MQSASITSVFFPQGRTCILPKWSSSISTFCNSRNWLQTNTYLGSTRPRTLLQRCLYPELRCIISNFLNFHQNSHGNTPKIGNLLHRSNFSPHSLFIMMSLPKATSKQHFPDSSASPHSLFIMISLTKATLKCEYKDVVRPPRHTTWSSDS
jgi:hypothetical protein